jgi:uncharacterized caspase-like protein
MRQLCFPAQGAAQSIGCQQPQSSHLCCPVLLEGECIINPTPVDTSRRRNAWGILCRITDHRVTHFAQRGIAMLRLAQAVALMLAIVALSTSSGITAEAPEKRLGLVIGNSSYAAGGVPTAANDAGLIAQTLQASGFDIIGARDLDSDALRRTFRDFSDKVAAAGPDTVIFIYLAGHGLQFEGENFFVPIDAAINRDLDVPVQALRLNDYLRPLAALKTKGIVVVLDVARENPFAKAGVPLAGGLALIDPAPGMMFAFNAAPGTIAPAAEPPYGPYAKALAEMIREGGLPLGTVFDRIRLRVNDATGGAVIPWHASQIKTPFVFFERAPDAPASEASYEVTSARSEQPIRDFDAREAYLAALERDTLRGYLEFLEAFPDDPMAKRVRAIVAARREAITWRKTRAADTPEAYWSYLDRYPKGPHAWDARRRLAYLTASPEPPPQYTAFYYDVPPPPREEYFYIHRPVVVFYDPVFAFAPPPPPPIFFLPPPPPPLFFRPPPPPIALFVLPVPVFTPFPAYVRAPAYVAPPPNNVVFNNIHNTTIINNTTVIQQPGNGPPQGAPAPAHTVSPGAVAGGVVAAGVVGAAAAKVALPPSLASRATAQPASANAGVPAASLVPPTGSASGANKPPLPKGPIPASGQNAASAIGPPKALPVPGAGGLPAPRSSNAAPARASAMAPSAASPLAPSSPGAIPARKRPQTKSVNAPAGSKSATTISSPAVPGAGGPSLRPAQPGSNKSSATATNGATNPGNPVSGPSTGRPPIPLRAGPPTAIGPSQRPPVARGVATGPSPRAPQQRPPAPANAKKPACGVQGTPPCK